jgi:rhodanese-related sulfurtransferase
MVTSISSDSLYAQIGLPRAPVIVDVRRGDDYAARPRLLPGARRGDPDRLAQWATTLARTRPIVLYCVHGQRVSQSAAQALSALGLEVSYLDGGIEGWIEAGHASVTVRPELGVPGASRWVTRERPKIDRLACPWLVRRFIDADALFFYAPAHRVRAEAETLAAQPYDIADVTFSHRGPRCSFDAFLDEFDLHDPVLDQLADIVRAADTGVPEKSPQAHGLLAISLGLSANIADDISLLEQAMPVYDALYAWCKTARDETHSWPQKKY